MASLEEVWGSPFPQKHHTMASKYHKKEEPRDAEKEGRVFPTPVHRTAAAVQRHRKTIDDLTNSLPIAESDEQAESNYAPARIVTTEHMTNFSDTKKFFNKPFYPSNGGTDFPYAPPSFQNDAHEIKLNQILRMIEQNKVGYEQPASQDMMLYIFTGIVFLFTLDTFVKLGKRMK
jgi:hypothetical protein